LSFSIKFLDKAVPKEQLLPGDEGLLVEITIGDFVEDTEVLTGFWSKSDYVNQWIEALDRIIYGEDDTKSALATVVLNPDDPKHGYVIHWWPMYKQGNAVYIQEESVPFDKREAPIDLNDIYAYVGGREKGVSEWTTSIDELKGFRSTLNES
jgi:hypothetical protein